MKDQEIKAIVQDEFSRLTDNMVALLQVEANAILKKLILMNKEQPKNDDSV